MRDSFRTGVGHDYDSHGPEGAVGIERSFEPWNRSFLLPVVLPALDGVVDKLRAGATVADIGCGAGGALILMAGAFPASTFHGYDISQYALARAEEKKAEAGVTNVHFHDPRVEPLPGDHCVDLVTTFDCIHDMTHPQEMIGADPRGASPTTARGCSSTSRRSTPTPRTCARTRWPSLMYGISVLSCMSSALSEPGGAGLGTLGLPESRARAMAAAAGFTRFERLRVDHAVNAFYEVRP